MDFHEFLYKIPKVELHCHLEGAVRATTFVELAKKNRVELPEHQVPDDLYSFKTIDNFFRIYSLVCHSLREPEDFMRVTYESLEDAAACGLRYREMFWSPQIHIAAGVSYQAMVDAFREATQEARRTLGVECRMIAGIALYSTPEEADALVETMLAHNDETVVGIGMDFGEKGNPPAKLLHAYKLAGEGGLRRCGHTGQLTPASNIERLLDEHGVERIDHGYSVVLDDRISQRCADEGVPFTVCPTATQIVYFPWDMGKHPIGEMVNRGIKISIGSDDPTMCWTNIGLEYVLMADHLGYTPSNFRQFVLNGIDACWANEETKTRMRKEWSHEIDDMIARIDKAPSPRYYLDEENYRWTLRAHEQPGLKVLASMR